MDNEKVNESLDKVLGFFKTGNIPQTIALATFPVNDLPSSKWSLTNKLIMILSGTHDARGLKQWNSVERKLIKGSKAFYILAPRKVSGVECKKCGKLNNKSKLSEENKCFSCGNSSFYDKEKCILAGFMALPVFRKEDTDGKSLNYENLSYPSHNFLDLAQTWGISVKTSLFNGNCFGTFRVYKDETQEIILASPEESVFFHELAHAAHRKLGLLRKSVGQNACNEIVAEFVSAVLCELSGKKSVIGNSFDYVKHYSKELELTPHKAVLKLLNEIEATLKLIFEENEKILKAREMINENSFVEASKIEV